MSPSENTVKELDEKYITLIVKFVSDIRNGKLVGSNNIALATVSLLEQIISEAENATAFELCNLIRGVSTHLTAALPQELVLANMARRVLRAVRDEYRLQANQSTEGAGESLQRLVLAAPSRRATLGPAHRDLREPIRDHIAELRTELEGSASSISAQAREHVHADELILTYGASALAERFLKAAASRRFKLILVEGNEVAQSHAMASRLSAGGVSVTVVGNACVGGVMSRVNKVIVGVRATLAGGAVLGPAGLHAVTTAAKYYSVPVIALSPLHKLSPVHGGRHHAAELASPHNCLPYQNATGGSVHVLCPTLDSVPPDHVTLFITNLGGSSPSYIYRLLSELYDPSDYQI